MPLAHTVKQETLASIKFETALKRQNWQLKILYAIICVYALTTIGGSDFLKIHQIAKLNPSPKFHTTQY